MTPLPALEVSQLRVVREHHEILRSLSFDVSRGELVGLLGPSGSGKSTLKRSLLGVQRITSGSASSLGQKVGAPFLRRQIGYMAQGSAVYLDPSVRENLAYFAGILGVATSQVEDCLVVVNLRPFAHRLVASLSGGERSRLSLAVATLGAPPLLILDEPTVGLDPVLRQDLWRTSSNSSRPAPSSSSRATSWRKPRGAGGSCWCARANYTSTTRPPNYSRARGRADTTTRSSRSSEECPEPASHLVDRGAHHATTPTRSAHNRPGTGGALSADGLARLEPQ